MNILIIDGMNFLHRCRVGFNLGDNGITFNAFRNLRAVVEAFPSDKVFFVLEGSTKDKKVVLESYKANRKIEAGSAKELEMAKFFKQVNDFLELAQAHLPVSFIRHPNHEADDTIANIVLTSDKETNIVIVSSDTDFIQLLGSDNVKLWNPIKKVYVPTPDYDYVVWKSLRGDSSDNIPGIPGIGDVTATKIASNVEELKKVFSDDIKREIFTRNFSLIKLNKWEPAEAELVETSKPKKDWDIVKHAFEERNFNSLLKDKTWNKFVSTFDRLFDSNE